MKITTLILDLGNVLIHNHPEWAAKKFAKLNGRSLVENLKIMENNVLYMKGKITPSEFAQRYINSMNLNISEKRFHEIYVDIFSLNKSLFNFLKRIKKKVNLVMLSNTEEVTIEFLKKKFPELFSLFNGRLVLSYEIHLVKPQKKIYLYALKIAKAEPQNAVFIDDKEKYIEAARNLGINAVQYKTFKSFKKDLKRLGFLR